MSLAERLPRTIETDRLVLTPLREDDADEMVKVLASPDLYVFTGGEPPTLDDLRRCGYASEAAVALVGALVDAGVGRVVAHIHPGHAASEAVAQRCGLTPTEDFHDGERRWEWRRQPR